MTSNYANVELRTRCSQQTVHRNEAARWRQQRPTKTPAPAPEREWRRNVELRTRWSPQAVHRSHGGTCLQLQHAIALVLDQ
jgi:hypothetical protein